MTSFHVIDHGFLHRGLFLTKPRQRSLARALVCYSNSSSTSQVPEHGKKERAVAFVLHHEPGTPCAVPGAVNQPCPPEPSVRITEIPGGSFVFAENNRGRQRAGSPACLALKDIFTPGILAPNCSSRQQKVFIVECHSQGWLLQEPECGWQNILPVQHIAQTL